MSQELLPRQRNSARPNKITVLLADDHPLIRQALKNVIEKHADLEIVGEAGDGEEAVKLADKLLPDVVIMDIVMPKLNGLEATQRIKAAHPNVAVLVLTVHDDDQYILGILQAGAAGYLTKSVFGDEVVRSIHAVVSGEMVLSPPIGRRLLKQAAKYPTDPVQMGKQESLSARELVILKLAARGMSNQSIAQELGLTQRTIKGYLANIFSKLNVSSRTEAAVVGLRSGFISVDDL